MEQYPMPPIHVINLQRSTKRKEQFIKFNAHLTYKFFPAFDGAALDSSLLNSKELFIQPLPFPSLGAFGCALSHFALWKLAVQNQSAITIAEDDAIFRYDFASISTGLIESLPSDWDIVYWGWNLDAPLIIDMMGSSSSVLLQCDQNRVINQISAFQHSKEKVATLKLNKCFGTPAYTISAKGAKTFLRHCFPIKNKNVAFPLLSKSFLMTGVDMAMNLVFPSTKSYVTFPPLAVTPNDHLISTIQLPNKN